MNRIIATIIGATMVLVGLWCAPIGTDGRSPAIVVPILMYHHVGNWGPSQADWAPWVVLPEDFRAQMDWLVQHGYRTINSFEVRVARFHGFPIDSPSDGWRHTPFTIHI